MRRTWLLSIKGKDYSPIGLDVGATSVKMAQLKNTAAGWVISEMREKMISVSQQESGESRTDAIVRSINACMKEASFAGRSVVSVMPGYQLDILPVKLSVSGEESVEDAILEKARAHLSYTVENAVIDYIPVEDGESGEDQSRPVRSLLISARREDVDTHLSILKRAKLKPLAIDMSACALARLIRFSGTEKENNVLVVNAGDQHTSLTLVWKNNILLDRTVPWGRENLLGSLMNRLKLSHQKADGLLSRNGLSTGHSEEPGQVHESLAPVSKTYEVVHEIIANQLEKLSTEIDKVLQYFSSEMRGAEMDVLYIMGTAGMIRDMDTYLEKRTGIAAKPFNPEGLLNRDERGNINDTDGYGVFFGVPLGLAMRGIRKQDVQN